MRSATELHYQSGDYWRARLDSASDFKVALALRALHAVNIELSEGVRAAEIGCGNGAFLFPLAATLSGRLKSFTLRGIDIAPLAITHANARAREAGENRISFIEGSAADVKERFDIAFLMDVVEHVSDPFAFLQAAKDIAPIIVLHLPIEHSVAHRLLRKPTAAYKQFKHIHFFSLETMRILLQEVGLIMLGLQFTAASPEVFKFSGGPFVRTSRAVRYCAYKLAPAASSILFGGSVMVVMSR